MNTDFNKKDLHFLGKKTTPDEILLEEDIREEKDNKIELDNNNNKDSITIDNVGENDKTPYYCSLCVPQSHPFISIFLFFAA